MIASLGRILKGSLANASKARRPATLQDLQTARSALLQCVDDCEGLPVQRLRYKIDTAKSGQELWLLRNDAYQLVSQRHTQAVATERINALNPCFESFMDTRQLMRSR